MKCMQKILSVMLVFTLALSLSLPVFSAPTLQTSMVSNMLKMINKVRENAGLETLSLDKDLQEAAQLRAIESVQKYSQNHTRPNGQKFFSASTKIWAENTAYGYKSAEAVMDGWTNSKGHLANILDSRFTIVGVACAESNDGTLYWVQNFGTGTSNMSWAIRDHGVKTFTLDPFNDPKTPMDKTKNTSSSKTAADTENLIDKDGNLIASALDAELKKAISATKTGTVSVQVKNAKRITPDTLKSFANTAASAGRTATIFADTLDSNGKSVQGRIILDPAKLTGRKTNIKLGVYVDKDSIATVKAAMEKHSYNTMAYIHMEQQGTLTANTRISAKVDLAGLDTNNLLLYIYNKKQDTLVLISNPDCYIDSSGYFEFSTKTAGDIVITDEEL